MGGRTSLEGGLSPNRTHRSTRAALIAALMTSLFVALAAGPSLGQAAVPTWSQYQGGPGHAGAMPDGPQPPFRVRWRLEAPAGEALSPAIVLGEQAVTVGTEAVYGVNVSTGDVAWEIARAGGPLSAPAATDDGRVLLFLEGPRASEAEPSGTASPSAPSTPAETASPTAGGDAGPPEDEQGVSTLVAVGLEDREEIWRVSLQAVSRSGVTVDGTAAFVGDQEGTVYAVDLQDGSVNWSEKLQGRVDTPVAVSGGRVFAVARDEGASQVTIVALDSATGERAWGVIPRATSNVSSALVATDEAVLVGSADRLVRSLAPADGAERWTALALSFFSPATAPAAAGDAVYAADLSGGLYRLDAADGARVWSFQLNEVVLRSAPVISGSTVLLGLNDGRLVAVDAGSGHLVWESEATPGLVGTIALGPDVVIAVKGGREAGLIAFEPDPDGALVDLRSPTELDAGTTLSRYALAAVIVLAIALVPGIALSRRLGPPNLGGEGAGDEDGAGEDHEGEGDEA